MNLQKLLSFSVHANATPHLLFPATRDHCRSTHLIEGDGTFNVTGVDNFVKEVKLAECGLSYAVVAIMGPQSSGMKFGLQKACFSIIVHSVSSAHEF